jgi:arylsulfatase A-like enzyme
MAVFLVACGNDASTGREPAESNEPQSVFTETEAVPPPNILFISIDDLNNWIEPLGGHAQAITPNLSRLAREGATFTRAYTASPACNPSRMALLTGRHTYSTGMYSNYQNWRVVMPGVQTLPQYFTANGYWAGGAGKIFHNNQPSPESWDEYFPSKEKHMPDYHYPAPGETVGMPMFENMYTDFDWAPIGIPVEETGDYRSVSWAIDQLNREREKPFFLAVGIYRPHVPWYVPQEFFDQFPLESVQLPKVIENDLDDVPGRGRNIAARSGNYHKHVLAAGQWKEAVQGYLASITYADALVGKLLDALEQSEHRDNTIIILWSDHGWQLGEKEHWRKFALWDNVAQVVMMMKVPESVSPNLPEGTIPGSRIDRVTSLIDIFPTLTDLAALPEKGGLDGRSLTPLLRDPAARWDHPAITTYDFDEFSVRTEQFRYIRYIDGGEELYDHRSDPEEWTNLADAPEYAVVKAEMIGHIPVDAAPMGPTIELEPHHTPPFASVEQYETYIKARNATEN